MNGILLDTSVYIAFERGRFDLDGFLAKHAERPVAFAAISISEMWHGVERDDVASRRRLRAGTLEAMIDSVEVLDFNADVARIHAQIWAALEKKGERIGAYDLLIAATAVYAGYGLATLNPKEFQRVKGLKLIDIQPYSMDSRS